MPNGNAAKELADRILALIPKHPEILGITDLHDLFKVDGFKSADLDLTYAQAAWALRNAKKRAKCLT
jgi:hypothetical protein